ncbi:MAG: hypothetical protein DRI36_06290 [Caldiserica bacterium]|nr:MAG: hypothetical protein DRI36_06290 [Caldisericota bacterium]
MSSSSRKNFEISEEITEYIKYLSKRIDIKAVILFGSLARGDNTRLSDADLFIVSDDFPDNFRKRLDLLWEKKPLNVDVLGWKTWEIKEKIYRAFILNVLTEGKVIYGDATYFKNLAKDFIKKRKLVKKTFGYIKK